MYDGTMINSCKTQVVRYVVCHCVVLDFDGRDFAHGILSTNYMAFINEKAYIFRRICFLDFIFLKVFYDEIKQNPYQSSLYIFFRIFHSFHIIKILTKK